MSDRKKSKALFDEALKFFPGGVHSPVRAFKSVDGHPIFMKSGKGCRIKDVDDNEYIDFCCSWGPLILGHGDPFVKQHIAEILENGTSFGTPTEHGNLLGRLIIDNHQFIEKIRFVNSGTEAVMSAIRLARGITGKRKIVKFEGCYHGHYDPLLVKAGSGLATSGIGTSAGVPESYLNKTLSLPLNDLDAVEEVFGKFANDIACVIIEPIPANNGLLIQKRSYLNGLKQLCERFKVLLIFDEVISGFRVGFEGAAGYYNIQPDIVTFGKIIGGGLPVGAYAAKKEYMAHVAPDGPVYQAGTLSANPLAMAAGYATLKKVLEPKFYQNLNKRTRHFTDQIAAYCQHSKYDVQVSNIGSIFWIQFATKAAMAAGDIQEGSMDNFKKFHGHCLDQGIYFGPSGYEVGFVSQAHSDEDLEEAGQKICQAIDLIFGE